MTNAADRRPFSMPYVADANCVFAGATNSGVMIARAPWPAPVNKYFVLRKVVATQTNFTSGGFMAIWDQDLSNTTPVGRGSGSGPLLQVPLAPLSSGTPGGPTMTILDIDACPQQYFQAGVVVSTNVSGTANVCMEFDVV